MITSLLLNTALAAATLVTPAAGDTGVSPAAPIVVRFSEAMSHTTEVTITPAVACHYAWSADVREVTCQHLAPLASATTYTVSADTMNAAFTTGASLSPNMSGSVPANGARLGRSSAVVVTFDRPMDQASTEAAVSFPADTTMHGDFTWNGDATQLTFTPAVPWAQFYHDAWTMMVIDRGATSSDGFALTAPLILTFSLSRRGVVTLPIACSTTLADDALTTSLSVDLTAMELDFPGPPPTALTMHVTATHPHDGLTLGGHAPIHRVRTSDPATKQLVYDLTTDLEGEGAYQGTFTLGYAAAPPTPTQIGSCLLGISYELP